LNCAKDKHTHPQGTRAVVPARITPAYFRAFSRKGEAKPRMAPARPRSKLDRYSLRAQRPLDHRLPAANLARNELRQLGRGHALRLDRILLDLATNGTTVRMGFVRQSAAAAAHVVDAMTSAPVTKRRPIHIAPFIWSGARSARRDVAAILPWGELNPPVCSAKGDGKGVPKTRKIRHLTALMQLASAVAALLGGNAHIIPENRRNRGKPLQV
jgi:hypothetical protein